MEVPDLYEPPKGRVEDVADDRSGPQKAERVSRLLAQIVDGLIVAVPAFALMIPFIWLAEGSATSEWLPLMIFVPMILAGAVNLYLLARSGQTMGKRVIGVRIVRVDGSKAGLGRLILLRMAAPGIIGLVPIVGFIFAIANILFIFREDRRCIHDWMADTVVVKA